MNNEQKGYILDYVHKRLLVLQDKINLVKDIFEIHEIRNEIHTLNEIEKILNK